MVSGVVAVTVGLPGSGKTSLCNQFLKRFSNLWNIIHVSYDKIIDDRKNWASPDFQWRTERTNVIRWVERLISQLLRKPLDEDDVEQDSFEYFLRVVSENDSMNDENNFVLLIDDNMYYRSMRYIYFQLARKHRLGFIQLYFKCSLEKALMRNADRSRSEIVSEDVIRRMSERLEPPDGCRNEWEKRVELILIDDHDISMDDLCSKLNYILIDALNDIPLLPIDEKVVNELKAKSKLETVNSNFHKIDLILRKTIAEIRKSYADRKRDDTNEICIRLSHAKTQIMSKLRSKILDANLLLLQNDQELKRIFLDFADLSNESINF